MARKSIRNEPQDKAASNNAVFINNYPLALCHARTTTRSFTSVNFKLNGRWASFALPNNMLMQSNKRNGQPIPTCKNLFLGQADEVRTVSVQNTNGGYDNIKMSNAEILKIITENRVAYRESAETG